MHKKWNRKIKFFKFKVVLFGIFEDVKYVCQIEQCILHFKFIIMNKIQQDLRLLPGYFKKVAFGIMLFSALLVVLSTLKVLTIDKEIVKTIVKSVFLISLLLLVITRNKIEDELTLKIRLKAFAFSFIYGVIIVIIEPFIYLLFGDSFLSDKGVTELLISMFFCYFIMMFLMKKNR